MKTRLLGLTILAMLLLSLVLSACGDTSTPSTASTTAAATTTSATTTTAAMTTAASTTAAAVTTTTAAATTSQAATTATTTASTTAAAATSGDSLAVVKMPATIAGGRSVTISVVGKPLDTDAAAVKQWNDQVARFEKLYPNVTIKGSQYQYAPDTFAAMIAGKQVPTLFEVYLTDPQNMVKQGIAADITSYFNTNNLQSIYNPNILSLATVNSKVYGIPEFAYGMGLAYNMDMFKAANISKPPATWDELAADAALLTKRSQNVSGFAFINDGSAASGWALTTMAYGFGAKPTDLIAANGDGTYVANYAKSSLVDTLKYIQNLRWNSNVLPLNNNDWAGNGQAFATGRSAMSVMAGDQFSWIRITYPDVNIKKFAFAPLPASPDGTSISLVGGDVAMINNTATDDQKEAALYYKLWTTFDPNELKASLKLRQSEAGQTIGAPLLPLYTGSYQQALDAFQQPYNNMPVENYKDFLDAVTSGKLKLQAEPGPGGQDYYTAVGSILSSVLTSKSADPSALLTKSATTFQSNVLDRMKK